MKTQLLSSLVGISLIAGCATESGTGTAVGAGAGALLGGAVGGTGGALFGAAVGGILGYGVGHQVEIENQRRMEMALASNQPVYWSDPETGNAYRVRPRPIYYEAGRPCREFAMHADVQGRGPREVYGTACQDPNGDWCVVSTD